MAQFSGGKKKNLMNIKCAFISSTTVVQNFPHSENTSARYQKRIFHSRTVHLDIIRVLYLPTDAQENCFKQNIKIYIKTALICFGLITIIRERTI